MVISIICNKNSSTIWNGSIFACFPIARSPAGWLHMREGWPQQGSNGGFFRLPCCTDVSPLKADLHE